MTTEPNLVPGWLQVAFGAALGAAAIAAVRVDVINNYTYGLATGGPELATVLVIAALCVVLVPSAAAILGWSALQSGITGICVVLTCWAALNAYADKFGSEILTKTAQATAYADAEKDKEAARATLERITETADAATLQQLADAAKVKADGLRLADTKKMGAASCFKTCQAADGEHAKYLARLAEAKARDTAKAALSQARQEAKAGPAEASAIATMLASRNGDNPASIARVIGLAVTILGIAVTQGVALLAHLATSLMAGGLRRMFARDGKAPAPKTAKTRKRKRTKPAPAPVNVVALDKPLLPMAERGMTQKAIAAATGLSPSTVGRRLAKERAAITKNTAAA